MLKATLSFCHQQKPYIQNFQMDLAGKAESIFHLISDFSKMKPTKFKVDPTMKYVGLLIESIA